MESTMITEPKITSYTFNWKISRFDIICPMKCSEFKQLTSDRFTVKGDDGMETQWSVMMIGSSGFIQLFLNFENAINADGTCHSDRVRCQFTLSICDDERKGIAELSTEYVFPEKGNGWGWDEFLTIDELYRKRDTLLKNNILHIRLDMRIYGRHSTSLLPLLKSEGTVNPVEILAVDLEQLFNNKSNSDVEISCGSETFHAHKLILSARSKVFTAMLESDMQEAATSKIVLSDIDAVIFRAILLYIYTGKVEMNETISYAELIYGAEKYDLAELKQYCFEQMCNSVTIDTVGNLAVAAEVYNADEKIRRLIKEYCQSNMAELLAKDPEIKTQMISHPKAFF